jgi:uncharacterized protein YjbI with pentapeptide repeats
MFVLHSDDVVMREVTQKNISNAHIQHSSLSHGREVTQKNISNAHIQHSSLSHGREVTQKNISNAHMERYELQPISVMFSFNKATQNDIKDTCDYWSKEVSRHFYILQNISIFVQHSSLSHGREVTQKNISNAHIQRSSLSHGREVTQKNEYA